MEEMDEEGMDFMDRMDGMDNARGILSELSRVHKVHQALLRPLSLFSQESQKGPDAKMIAVDAEPADHPGADFGNDRFAAKLLACIDV